MSGVAAPIRPQKGRMHLLQWNNPYTTPPAGLERIQGWAFSFAGEHSAELEARYQELGGLGSGWGFRHQAVTPPARRWSPERRGAMRVANLLRRLTKGKKKIGPMFVEQVLAEEIAKKPDYYAGLDETPERAAYLADVDARDRERWVAWVAWWQAEAARRAAPAPLPLEAAS